MIYNKENILSGYNFARICQHVYAENLIDSEDNPIPTVFGVDLSNIEPQQTIFCKTDYIFNLFNDLNVLPEWFNLNLVTHESDYEINEKIFLKKPKCIKKWYAINVNYENKDLISIPLGIGNQHSKITLKIHDIKSSENFEKLLYINHRSETNIASRRWIYDYFKTNNWLTIENPNLTLGEFSKQLSRHRYMLCPKGNGIDTHRLWECLYSGVIPVVENHINYKSMGRLPILFVKSFKEINEQMLLDNLNIFDKTSKEQLNINWWKKFIEDTQC